MPDEKTIASLYHEDLEHFEPYIEQLPVHRAYFRKKIQEIQRVIHTNRHFSLLDIGCAMGVLLEEAKKVGVKGQGVDISKDAVMYCKAHGLTVSESWPTRKKFDVITAFEIIEHERSPMTMMQRIHTLLKNGGYIVMTTPNHSNIWRKVMGSMWVGYRHPEHVTFWDERSLFELLKRSGFKNITIQKDSPRPFPLSFVFTRGADYFPWLSWLLRPVGKLVDRFHLVNPMNPWGDMIAYATK